MVFRDIHDLPDYKNVIDRNKIRFSGIGPRLHEIPDHVTRQNSIWPRDAYNCEVECRKILNSGIVKIINDQVQCDRIRAVLMKIVDGVTKVNVDRLYKRYCPLDSGQFDRITFEINTSLDAYSPYRRILIFIDKVMYASLNFSSQNMGNTIEQRNQKNSLLWVFGTDHNYTIFKRNIKLFVINNAKSRQVIIGHFVEFGDSKMNIDQVSWLEGVVPEARAKLFIQVIFFFARFVAELLRRYFYITVGNPYMEKLFYFRYDLWQRIKAKALKQLVERKPIPVLYRFLAEENIDLPDVSKFKFYLKKDNVRMICTTSKKSINRNMLYQIVAVLDYILNRTRGYKKFTLNLLLAGLRYFKRLAHERKNSALEQNQCLKEDKRIFFVKADIKDFFQSVDQEKLRTIIESSLKSYLGSRPIVLTKFKVRSRGGFSLYGDRKIAKNFSKWTMDPESFEARSRFEDVTRGPQVYLTIEKFNEFYIRPHLVNPVVRESYDSKICYNLVSGLRQGSPLSPLLSSIYIQKAFEQYLGEFLEVEDCHLYRYVDDILFISCDLERSKLFMKKMLNGFRDFGLKMNLDKLACNFDCSGLSDERLCRLPPDLLFYKQLINQETLQCAYSYPYERLELQFTFRVNPYLLKQDEIIHMIVNSRIELILFDCELNGIDRVLKNIFDRSLLLAHRSATLILINLHWRKLDNQNERFVTKLVQMVARRIYMAIKCGKKLIENNLNFFQIRLLVAAAFSTTWKSERMRHRIKERSRIENIFKRYNMRYLLLSSEEEEERSRWESKLRELMRNFPNSPFAKEVKLPSKKCV